MTHYIVRARSDGRAGMPMFGLSGPRAKSFAGQTVYIGDREVTVGRDGRINIPKDIMETYGVVGDDGRRRVSINFASDRSEEHTSELQSRENLVCRLLLEKKK